jgi:hypothetical protein
MANSNRPLKFSKKIIIKITPEQHAALEKIKNISGENVSVILRRLINNLIKKYKKYLTKV